MKSKVKNFLIIIISFLFIFGNFINISAKDNKLKLLNKINSKSKIEIVGEELVQIPVVGETMAIYKLKHKSYDLKSISSKITYKILQPTKGVSINNEGTLIITTEAKSGEITIESKIDKKWSGKIKVQLYKSWVDEYEKNEKDKVSLVNSEDFAAILSYKKEKIINTLSMVIGLLIMIIIIIIIIYINIWKNNYLRSSIDAFKKENEVD